MSTPNHRKAIQRRTLSIRINPNRKAIAIQGRFPITPEEWEAFMQKLDALKPELTEGKPQ